MKTKLQLFLLVGPSSIVLALMGSGMNGQDFKFNGYLPIDNNERKKQIKVIRKKIANYTLKFLWKPHIEMIIYSLI